MKPFQPPPAIDQLEQFLGAVRPRLASQATPKARLELLWSFAKAARDLASQDVWMGEFRILADEFDLTAHYRLQDLDHVLLWAWRGWNPFR
jgi:hypothetical protein